MTLNKISVALHPQLTPKSKNFLGGRITKIDLLRLDLAAEMATKHAGSEVTPDDFLRAAGRGEIELIALVRKETKFKYLDSPELEPWITEGGGWRIPLHACKDLANKGFARWRTQEDVEPYRGSYMQYRTTICITDDEPDLKAEPSDCRVLGHYVHALADAFRPQAKPESQKSIEPAPVVTDSASNGPVRARRDLLTPVIEAAQRDCESPFDTPAVWASLVRMAGAGKTPLLGVTDEGIKWKDSNDEPQFFKIKSLRSRLHRSKERAR